MKYASIDIETTGLNSERHQILSIGVIIEDTKLKLPFSEIPKLHLAITRQGDFTGSLFAINLNRELLAVLNQYQQMRTAIEREMFSKTVNMVFTEEPRVALLVSEFLAANGIKPEDGRTYLTVAGKNFGTFDKLFLEKLPKFSEHIKIRQRILDPVHYYIDWSKDEDLPSLSTCKERAYYSPGVSHNAIEDAWDVIMLMRNQY